MHMLGLNATENYLCMSVVDVATVYELIINMFNLKAFVFSLEQFELIFF